MRHIHVRMLRTSVVVTLALFVIVFITRTGSTQTPGLDGFTDEGSTAQRRLEAQFRSIPAPSSAREHLRRLTLEPHVAGTKEDYETAVYVRDQMRSYGLAA